MKNKVYSLSTVQVLMLLLPSLILFLFMISHLETRIDSIWEHASTIQEVSLMESVIFGGIIKYIQVKSRYMMQY